MKLNFDKIKRFAGSIFLLPVALYLIFNKGQFIFILDHVNLLFHEGGHGIFSLFGKFVYTSGGSLMQIIIPSLFIYYCVKNNKLVGTQLSFLYLAENMMNISVYVGDARTQKLPLLGGNKVYHDWNYLLGQTGLLQYDTTISSVIYYSAVLMCIIAILIPLFWKDYKVLNINLSRYIK